VTAPTARPAAMTPASPSAAPSCARSKLTALINAPAPKAKTSPTRRDGHGRNSPRNAPITSEDAASTPQPTAAVTARILREFACSKPLSLDRGSGRCCGSAPKAGGSSLRDGRCSNSRVDGEVAGCGGWSRRATLYGGTRRPAETAGSSIQPSTRRVYERCTRIRVRTARRGPPNPVALRGGSSRGRVQASRADGDSLSGEPLYSAYGFQARERLLIDTADGVAVPCIRIHKSVRLDLLT
jgi:hypothetical protein